MTTHSIKGTTHPIKGTYPPIKTTTRPIKGTNPPIKGTLHTIKGTFRPIKGTTHSIQGTIHPIKGTDPLIKGRTIQSSTWPLVCALQPFFTAPCGERTHPTTPSTRNTMLTFKLPKPHHPMLKFDPLRIMKMRNIEQPFPYLRGLGFTHHVSHLIAKGNYLSVKLKHIEILCQHLVCAPNDLFSYTPDSPTTDLTNDTLAPLIRTAAPPPSLTTMLKNVPLDRLEFIFQTVNANLTPNQDPTAGSV